METHNHNQLKQSEKGAWLSIATFLSLAAIKLTIGITFHSEALRADGLNNTTDVFAAIAILVGLKIAQKPPDSDHPYGHFRAETIASLIASFIIFAVGLQVLIEGMRSIFFAEGSGTTYDCSLGCPSECAHSISCLPL